jgi:hypothetical protein
LHGDNNTAKPGINQRLGARRRTAMMGARFQSYVYRCPLRFSTSLAKRMYFSMGFARPLMPTFTNDITITHDNTTNPRIWISGKQPVLGQA